MEYPIGHQPKLSLVYAGRNDSYMGNFNWRLSTTLNYLAENLRQLGRLDEVEVIVTDWGSQEPLHTALTLSAAARCIVKFLIVPPELARRVQGDSDFAIVIAQNAAIRRSQGEYIGQADSDMLFTAESLRALFDVLEGKKSIGVEPEQAMIYTKRRHVPWRYVASSPSLAELDWFIHHCGNWLPIERFFGFEFAGPGFTIMHRQLWDDCSGYDERLIYRGWLEIDLGLRIRRKYPLINLQKIGLTAFHLEHFPSRSGNPLQRKLNPTEWNNAFRPNGDDWGLRGHDLQLLTLAVETREEPAFPWGGQSVHINSRLLKNIALVILNWLWYPIQFVFGRTVLLTQRLWYHLRVIQRLVAGNPLGRWPAIVWSWWIERQRRQ
jgi:hypothetical protein